MEPLRDESTGVLSWPAFIEFGNLAAGTAARRSSTLALVIVRVDDSPAILQDVANQVAPAAALMLAEVLKRSLRAGDFIGRHGPRSFAVLGQDVPEDGAARFAQRIRESLPDRLNIVGMHGPFGASIGLAAMPQSALDFGGLLQKAEEALGLAMARGGNMDWLSGGGLDADQSPSSSEPAPPAIAASPFELADITRRRREGLKAAAAAFERGESEGLAIRAAAGACPICLNAARDLYAPHLAPTLPLVGCTSPAGCRCVYVQPADDPRRHPRPLGDERYRSPEIPRRLADAARFGAHGRGGCKPEMLAEYLDHYPLLPIEAGVRLQPNEVPFLKRDARRAWEAVEVAPSTVRGRRIPIDGALQPAASSLSNPPALPRLAGTCKGTLYVTNWRLLFRAGRESETVLLLDVAGLECFRDGLVCRLGDRGERLVLALKDSMQVGLVLARAVQDAALAAIQ